MHYAEVVEIRILKCPTHPLTKRHICHIGVNFFVCGPIFLFKIVLKASIDFATQWRVLKFYIVFLSFKKNKKAFLSLIIRFFPCKFIIYVKKNSFFSFWYWSILKPYYWALGSWIDNYHLQNRKKCSRIFYKKYQVVGISTPFDK